MVASIDETLTTTGFAIVSLVSQVRQHAQKDRQHEYSIS